MGLMILLSKGPLAPCVLLTFFAAAIGLRRAGAETASGDGALIIEGSSLCNAVGHPSLQSRPSADQSAYLSTPSRLTQ